MADLSAYSQDFEQLNQQDPGALAGDGWLVFGNVFSPDGSAYFFGYGPFPAPNGGPGFSGIDVGQGGSAQGVQQLVVYSDYNCCGFQGLAGHAAGNLVESNVFQEQIIGAADIGQTWRFSFDAKRGNIVPPTTALAFIKVLNPATGFSLSRFNVVDTSNLPDTWSNYDIDVFISPDLEGQILQIGFLSTTSFYTPSANFYDNINWDLAPVPVALDVKPGGCPNPVNVVSPADLPVAILGSADLDVTTIDVASLRLAGVEPLRSDYEDEGTVFEPLLGKTDCRLDCNELESDGFTDLTLKFDLQDVLDALGNPSDRECVVVGITGYFLQSAGGGAIEGEDVIIIIDPADRMGSPNPGGSNLWTMPSF